MRRLLLFMVLASVIPQFTFGQMPPSDSQNLKDLLTEVRELHQDLRQSLGRLQNAQILLTRLNLQQEVVNHALQSLDIARANFSNAQSAKQNAANRIENLEGRASSASDQNEQKALQQGLDNAKRDLESAVVDVRQRETARIDAEQQLQAQQDKLSTIETELDELIKNTSPRH